MLQSLLKFMSIELVILPNHLSIYCALLLLPSIFPSIRVFSKESALCIRWPKYQSFSFSISPSNEYSGLISFWIDWLDLLVAQGTLKSLLQHHNLKAFLVITKRRIIRVMRKLGCWVLCDGSLFQYSQEIDGIFPNIA